MEISRPLCLSHDYFQTLLHSWGSSSGRNVNRRHMCSPLCALGIAAFRRGQGFWWSHKFLSQPNPKGVWCLLLTPWNSPGKAKREVLGECSSTNSPGAAKKGRIGLFYPFQPLGMGIFNSLFTLGEETAHYILHKVVFKAVMKTLKGFSEC